MGVDLMERAHGFGRNEVAADKGPSQRVEVHSY